MYKLKKPMLRNGLLLDRILYLKLSTKKQKKIVVPPPPQKKSNKFKVIISLFLWCSV